MKTLLSFGLVTRTFITLTTRLAQPAPLAPVQEFMRQKLEHSTHVLAGLAIEDFDLISKNARKLRAMSVEAGWRSPANPDYAWRMDLFRRTVDTLASSAADRNLDGATLAYLNVTMSCIECHKFVRGKLSAQQERPGKSPISGADPRQPIRTE